MQTGIKAEVNEISLKAIQKQTARPNAPLKTSLKPQTGCPRNPCTSCQEHAQKWMAENSLNWGATTMQHLRGTKTHLDNLK